jgi:hypothetical protein
MADRGSLGNVVLEQSIAWQFTALRVIGALIVGGLSLGVIWVNWLDGTREGRSPSYVLIVVLAVVAVMALRALVLALTSARMKVTVFEGGLALERTPGAGVFAWGELRSAQLKRYKLSARQELSLTLRDGSTRSLETAFAQNDKLFRLIQARVPSPAAAAGAR